MRVRFKAREELDPPSLTLKMETGVVSRGMQAGLETENNALSPTGSQQVTGTPALQQHENELVNNLNGPRGKFFPRASRSNPNCPKL